MCRMLAVKTTDPKVRSEVLTAFRSQADAGLTGPDELRSHRDGWGFAGRLRGQTFQLARSIQDASKDIEYPRAVGRAELADPGTFVLAHVRNASVGGPKLENTHPFIRDGWAFAHNGTIHGLNAPEGIQTHGDTDSERYFLHILAEFARTKNMTLAIRAVVPKIAKRKNSSLTFLLTDGLDLFAFRAVGSDVGECGTKECQLEHYALTHGLWKGASVVLQEPALLPDLENPMEVPQGELLVVPRFGPPRLVPVIRSGMHLPEDAPSALAATWTEVPAKKKRTRARRKRTTKKARKGRPTRARPKRKVAKRRRR